MIMHITRDFVKPEILRKAAAEIAGQLPDAIQSENQPQELLEPTPERLAEVAKQLRRQYQREWRRRNREKIKQYQRATWERKARELLRQQSKSVDVRPPDTGDGDAAQRI